MKGVRPPFHFADMIELRDTKRDPVNHGGRGGGGVPVSLKGHPCLDQILNMKSIFKIIYLAILLRQKYRETIPFARLNWDKYTLKGATSLHTCTVKKPPLLPSRASTRLGF